MIIADEQEKRLALSNLLYELAANQDALKEKSDRVACYKKLEDIYYKSDNNFRHFYSDIYSALTVIDGNPESGNINILAQNMEIIKEGYKGNVNRDTDGNCIDVSKEVTKLYDHVNLDIGRLNYTRRITEDTKAELARASQLIEKLQRQVDESKEEMEKVSAEFERKANTLSDDIQAGQKKM